MQISRAGEIHWRRLSIAWYIVTFKFAYFNLIISFPGYQQSVFIFYDISKIQAIDGWTVTVLKQIWKKYFGKWMHVKTLATFQFFNKNDPRVVNDLEQCGQNLKRPIKWMSNVNMTYSIFNHTDYSNRHKCIKRPFALK